MIGLRKQETKNKKQETDLVYGLWLLKAQSGIKLTNIIRWLPGYDNKKQETINLTRNNNEETRNSWNYPY